MTQGANDLIVTPLHLNTSRINCFKLSVGYDALAHDVIFGTLPNYVTP